MKVLIIEDDKSIREFLVSNLEREGFTVDSTENGAKGSFLARTNPYDIIILDNVLPEKDGYEICRDVRERNNPVPILMLSIQSEVFDKVDLLNCGADDYMTKPFSFQELVARMNALMRRPREIEKEILTVDDLTLNVPAQKVKRGSSEIYLTRKEFNLLQFLAKNKGNVLSRNMIMEHVWNEDCDPFSNTIEAHILNLRKKIDVRKKRKLIYTVPGRGYKIDTAL